jgi:hypothetical protein
MCVVVVVRFCELRFGRSEGAKHFRSQSTRLAFEQAECRIASFLQSGFHERNTRNAIKGFMPLYRELFFLSSAETAVSAVVI